MDAIHELFAPEEIRRLERQYQIITWTAALLAAAAFLLCLALCIRTDSANAEQMERRTVLLSVCAGWAVIALLSACARPLRRTRDHARMLVSGERSSIEGVLCVSNERMLIRGSIRFYPLTLKEGDDRHRARVIASRAAALRRQNGKCVRLYLMNGYAAAWELLGDADAETSSAQLVPAARAPVLQTIWRSIRTIFSRLPPYVLWLLASVIGWGWIFGLISEPPPDRRLLLCVDATAMEDRALSLALEQERPEGIRAIKVHPFSYYLFGEQELQQADLYIVGEQRAAQLWENFLPLSQTSFSAAGQELWRFKGEAYGLRVYDAASGEGVLTDYINFDGGEDWYLFFGAQSPHIDDGAAAGLAERLLAMHDAAEDYILGMDVSSLIAEEQSGVRYYNFEGEEQDLLQILADNGLSHVRVRVWNDPYDEAGHGFGGGNCDMDKAREIGRRAAAYGLKMIVDFHYSDFWADPGKQMPPRAWQGMSAAEKAEAAYAFTCDSLRRIMDGGAEIGMVQLGNETNGALCGETDWDAITAILASASRAVRELCPQALVAVHFTNPENAGSYAFYAGQLQERGLDYDVFASSYYPYWHGSLDNLAAVLTELAELSGKRVMVMETSYAYTERDTDFFANTIGVGSRGELPWDFSVEGQSEALYELGKTVAAVPGGLGLCYWEGAWISVGQSSRAENSAKWERFGSGWASSFAAIYDPADAGKWYGGCAVENQALFDPTGRPLDSLRVFARLREEIGKNY